MTKAKNYRMEWRRGADLVEMKEARRKLGAAIRAKRMATLVSFRDHGMQAMRQSELARRIGITQKALGNIEQGDCFPSFPLYVAICRVFSVGNIPFVS